MYDISNERELFLPNVRIRKITLDQFKGVDHGELECNCAKEKKPFAQSDVLALYGQNGSGKTSIIDALNIVKAAISGLKFGPEFLRFISVNQPADNTPWAKITVEFIFEYPHGPLNRSVEDPPVDALVEYSLKLTRETRIISENDGFVGISKSTNYVGISEETVRTNLYDDGTLGRIHVVADSNNPKHMFCPAALEKFFFTDYNDISTTRKLSFQLDYSMAESQSFIFNDVVARLLRFASPTTEDQASVSPVYYNILCDLHLYATRYLYIAGMKTNGILHSGARIPIYFPGYYRPILFNITEDTVIPESVYRNLSIEFQKINHVLNMFIPNVNIEPYITRHTTLKNGQPAVGVEITSVHHADGKQYSIPLSYESAGILELISFLTLYIFTFNQKSATLVVDELDSGYHDALLRNILEIFCRKPEENGALGQLIFTCHNLTLMDKTLDKKYIRTTTTAKNDRYTKVQKIGVTNNLRDVYILRAKNGEEIYSNPVPNDKLCAALREAAEITGSQS